VKKSVGLFTVVGTDENDFTGRWDRALERAPVDTSGASREGFARDALVGTSDECIARIKEFEALGVEHLVCTFGLVPFSLSDEEQLDVFARDVLPSVR
jgi:alkanesulfonate monooxygenase SsuD/methylene tetrahydromethanopterin reductase-like flavin-dependent oxidoreductase (luciferase family)